PAAPAAAAPAAGPLLLVGAVGVGVVLVLAGLRDDLLVRGGLRLGFRLRLRLDRPYGLRLRRVGRLEQRREDGRRALEHGAAGFVVAAGVQAERVGQQVDLEVVLVEVLPGGLVVERLVLGQHLDDLVLFVGLGHLVRFGLRRGLRPRNSGCRGVVGVRTGRLRQTGVRTIDVHSTSVRLTRLGADRDRLTRLRLTGVGGGGGCRGGLGFFGSLRGLGLLAGPAPGGGGFPSVGGGLGGGLRFGGGGRGGGGGGRDRRSRRLKGV